MQVCIAGGNSPLPHLQSGLHAASDELILHPSSQLLDAWRRSRLSHPSTPPPSSSPSTPSQLQFDTWRRGGVAPPRPHPPPPPPHPYSSNSTREGEAESHLHTPTLLLPLHTLTAPVEERWSHPSTPPPSSSPSTPSQLLINTWRRSRAMESPLYTLTSTRVEFWR